MPILAEDPGYDPNRDQTSPSKQADLHRGVDPLAYLVGPVLVKYGGDPGQNHVVDLQPFIHKDQKLIQSITGEVAMDYGNGWCTLNSPKAQGVTGFLSKKSVFNLADVEIRTSDKYATVLVVALDDRALKDSAKILVQVGTTERPSGWKTQPVQVNGRPGEEVVSFCHAYSMIVPSPVAIELVNSTVSKARILDANGMPIKDISLETSGDRKHFQFPSDALYAVLQ
jgi:hypothetical protein